MKIIETKWNRRICPRCGSVLEFDYDDIRESLISGDSLDNKQFKYVYYIEYIINCPCCEKEILLEFDKKVVNYGGGFDDLNQYHQEKFFFKDHKKALEYAKNFNPEDR